MKSQRAYLPKIWFFLTLILSLALTLDFAYQCLAATIYVDDDTCPSTGSGTDLDPYCKIQDAIDVATSGDIVEVRDGIYYENVTMKDGVDVMNYSTDVPTIDADNTNQSAVIFNGKFSTGCILDGFVVINGESESNGAIYLRGTESPGIDNSTVITDCNIHDNSGPGIKIDGSTSITAPTIDNNNISNNSQEGIYVIDAGSDSEDAIIVNNTIENNTLAGINIGGDSYVTVGENNHIDDNYVGIAFDTGDPSSKPVKIIGNNIFNNDIGGIEIADAIASELTITQNIIYLNTSAGIGIKNSCTLVITKNTVYGNVRGGIKTGDDSEDPGGFNGTAGDAVLTIKQNKVYGNGASSYGGGIDVRHADGTIYNNLVYENQRGGIRFGDWIDEIINNTVSDNGNDNNTPDDPADDMGGGIIYDDIDAGDAVNDPPYGIPPAPILIRNNISTYNYKAGIRACFANTEGAEERDYNLVYSNFGWDSNPDCGWPGSPKLKCLRQQYGGCVANHVPDVGIVLDDPNDKIENPLFLDRNNDDYSLGVGSPAIDGGDPAAGYEDIEDPENPGYALPPSQGGVRNDMGAYGGPTPLPYP
jgi:hypothetical protein